MTTVRLIHPYHHANTGEVLELDDDTARTLIANNGARPVDELITHTGSGWHDVELHNPRRIVRARGYDNALERLRQNE